MGQEISLMPSVACKEWPHFCVQGPTKWFAKYSSEGPRQGQAEQSRNSRKEFHQTTYEPSFRSLYLLTLRRGRRRDQFYGLPGYDATEMKQSVKWFCRKDENESANRIRAKQELKFPLRARTQTRTHWGKVSPDLVRGSNLKSNRFPSNFACGYKPLCGITMCNI